MKKNPYITLSVMIAVFVIICVLIAAVGSRNRTDVPETDTSAAPDTSGTLESGTTTDTDSDTSSDTETPPDTDLPPDTETSLPWIESVLPLPEYETDTLGIGGGLSPDTALTDTFDAAIKAFDRPVSLFAVDLKTGVTLSYNAKAAHSSASVIKAAYAYYVCREIDAGKATHDEKLTYTAADTVYGDGVIGKAGVGKQYSIDELLRYMIVSSDNEAYYMLVRHFGTDGYGTLVSSLGCESLSIDGSKWPAITVLDMAKMWQYIYDYRLETETGAQLYGLFEDVEGMNFIKDALGGKVVSKAGRSKKQFHDSGIVFGEKATYIIVILTDGSYYSAVKSQFHDIVKAADAIMSAQ